MTETRSRPPDVRELVCVGNWQARSGPHGVLVSPAAWRPSPQPRGVIHVLPEPCDDLIGRHHEIEAVLTALRGGSPVNVWGECGIGKTSLLRQVAHWAVEEFRDCPVVFATAASKPLEDLLHEIHGCLFESPVPAKWRSKRLREQLRTVRAVVIIDDVALGDAELDDLLWALGGSLVVVASTVPRSDPALEPVALDGLGPGSAAELFLREVGNYRLGPGDTAEVHRLTGPELLRGHPLQVRQAAALVRAGQRTISELTRVLQFGDPSDRLAQECLTGLGPGQRQITAVMALAAGTYMPADLVAHMSAAEHVLDQLFVLRERQVLDSRWDWFGLPVCSVGEPLHLITPSLDLRFTLGGLVTWLQQPELSVEELMSVSGCILAILQFAREAGEWDCALEIVRGVEPALFVSGRWEQWRSVLETGAEAAGHVEDDSYRAYCLHQLGSRALCLGDRVQAARLLTQAASLRSRRHAREARSVTTHNLGLVSQRRTLPHSITTATAATVILAAGGLAAIVHFFHPVRPQVLVPPGSSAAPSVSASGGVVPSSGSLSPGKTGRSASPSGSSKPAHPAPPGQSPDLVTSQASPSATSPAGQKSLTTVVVNGVSPASGPAAGGTRVLITGQGLSQATGVYFGGISATAVTVRSDSEITATSPSGAGTVNVTVLTANGMSRTTSADRFTYMSSVPRVTGVSPASGPSSGGTTVTITGSGFAGATGVYFGGVSAGSITVDSGSKITVVSPPGTGTVDITVVTPNHTSSITAADEFTYTP